MKKIPSELWLPSDGLKLEPNALEAARSAYNALVFAGPGAGKTELLAQRASYLLQTGKCQFPKKILAISFKKDAAYNLKERVDLRCGEPLAKRFESMTFDAFSVNLLMRFHNALPDRYKIKGSPEVVLSDNPMLDEFKYQAPDLFNRVKKDVLLNFCYQKLPQETGHEHQNIREAVWMAILKKPDPKLPLKMIMRLSNLIIDRNPLIKSYLRKTYQYVFLDEFQDTTYIQYEFLSACFFDGPAVLTAVGDNKQRIMIWAGAKPTAFADFVKDTGAREIPLFMNFRSAPRLVALQNFFVEQLLGKAENAEASPHWHKEDGECYLWEYQRQQQEAEHLFGVVKQWIEVEGLRPRDICLLVKQTPDIGARDIISHFNANGIKVRNETDLQNLITEDLVLFIVATLYSSADRKYTKERLLVSEQMQVFSGVKDQDELLQLEADISKFQKQLKEKIRKPAYSREEVKAIVDEIIGFAGEKQIKAAFIEYKDEAYFQFILKNFSELLFNELSVNSNVALALDNCMGKDSIPVMTVHKSKGLEYHSIIFVGLEDSAFWTYSQQPEEDKCTFFVALSRAKRRIVFTFSQQRADKYKRVQSQAAENIKELWDSLENSGIAVRKKIV